MDIKLITKFAANIESTYPVLSCIRGNVVKPNTCNFLRLNSYSEKAVTGVILNQDWIFSGPKGRAVVRSLF